MRMTGGLPGFQNQLLLSSCCQSQSRKMGSALKQQCMGVMLVIEWFYEVAVRKVMWHYFVMNFKHLKVK